MLTEQSQVLQLEIVRKRVEIDNRRHERAELSAQADPKEINFRTQVIQILRSLVPRVDASRRVYLSCLERRDAISQEKATLAATLQSVQPPSRLAFLVFLFLIWTSAAGLFWASQPYIAAGIFVVSLSPLLWYRKRVKSTETIQKKLAECGVRLVSCQAELKNTEEEARQIESEIRQADGQGGNRGGRYRCPSRGTGSAAQDRRRNQGVR